MIHHPSWARGLKHDIGTDQMTDMTDWGKTQGEESEARSEQGAKVT